jgi:drug/metabolite transporter (DMT)-like permease
MEAALHRVRPLDRRALLLIVLLCLCWGLYQVSVKVASVEVSPLLQAGIRSIGSALLVWCRLRGIPLFRRDGTLGVGLLAGIGFAVEFAFIYLGIAHTDVSRATLLIYLSPFVVAVGAHVLVPGDRLSRAKLMGLLAAFGGLVLVFSGGQAGHEAHLVGDVLCVLGAVAWGSVTLLIKVTKLAHIRAEKILFYQLAVSALLLPPLAFMLGEHLPTALPSAVTLAALAYQIVAVSFASYIAWFWMITQYAPSQLASFTFLTPASSVLFGGLLLHEPVSRQIVLALLLIGGGIWLVNRGQMSEIRDQKSS